MKEYIVTLESKDKHVCEYRLKAETDDLAVKLALENVGEKYGYEFQYKLKQLERIK